MSSPNHAYWSPSIPPVPLDAFTGTWTGNGFNTIFRPNRNKTPLPNRATENPDANPSADPDNLLQLNLTLETLTFLDSLTDIPNRAFLENQPDAFLQGVPYTQSIKDVITNSGIHFEPGIWLLVPETIEPNVPSTVARMATIPHGTTILAQGTFETKNGGPDIPVVDITPFTIGDPSDRKKFTSQNAADNLTFRLPQTLPPTITQAMLDNPNSVLTDAIKAQNIIRTTTLKISTKADPDVRGSGTRNIAFLEGTLPPPENNGPNAQAADMDATFWIETVERDDGTTFTQIQYSQVVLLNFDKLSWPHVSVATLTQS
jgi:hypothetical protein